MKKILLLVSLLFGCMTSAFAQFFAGSGNPIPDVRYHVSGQKKDSHLSSDGVLFSVLVFEDESESSSLFWATNNALTPFCGVNPEYGRTLVVISHPKNKKRLEKQLGVSSYPEYFLIGPDRFILTRSNKAEDIVDYIITNLSAFTKTDWEAYLLRAKDLFDSGQVFAAKRIVSVCICQFGWEDTFSPAAHKVIPRIVASMKGDEWYMDFVGQIKIKYNMGLLTDEDVAPFKEEFSRIHATGDKDWEFDEYDD